MNKVGLLLPLVAAVLGACSTVDMGAGSGGAVGKGTASSAEMQPRVEPTLRITPGMAADQAAYLQGKQLLSAGKLEDAITAFRQSLVLNPANVDSLVGLGVAQSMSQRQPEAIMAFRQAVALQPGNAQWHANLGMALARDGQFDEAQQTLARAWAMEPGSDRIEAQYQRVSAAVREQQNVAREAAQQQAGMSRVSQDGSTGLRQVGERMFELDLDREAVVATEVAAPPLVAASVAPVAAPVVAPVGNAVEAMTASVVEPVTSAVALPPMTASSHGGASAPSMTDAARNETHDATHQPPIVIQQPTVSVAQTPHETMMQAGSPKTEIVQAPTLDKVPDPETLPFVFQGSRPGAGEPLPQAPGVSTPLQPVPAVSAPASAPQIPAATIAPAPAPMVAPVPSDTVPATTSGTMVDETVNDAAATSDAQPQAGDPVSGEVASPAALEAARQALFERRLEAARERAARTQARDAAEAAERGASR